MRHKISLKIPLIKNVETTKSNLKACMIAANNVGHRLMFFHNLDERKIDRRPKLVEWERNQLF